MKFIHHKINFISSNQRVISFYYINMSVSKIKKNKTKNNGMTSVRIWKISHSYPGCSFELSIFP